MFHVGQLVVCTYDMSGVASSRKRGEKAPIKGNVYTVRAVMASKDYPGTLRILLEEIVNPSIQYIDTVGEANFPAAAFRPAQETNIDVFKKVLASVNNEKERNIETDSGDDAGIIPDIPGRVRRDR